MKFRHSDLLRCPMDQQALREDGGRLCCDNGHSFDIARQGYVNLLGARDKRSRDPGDSKAMVSARRDFLEQRFAFGHDGRLQHLPQHGRLEHLRERHHQHRLQPRAVASTDRRRD